MTQVASEPVERTRFIPVTKWSDFHPWPSVQGLRWIIFNEHTNGFAKCVKRVGGRVLIDEAKFFEWVEEQQENGSPGVK